MTSLGTRDVTAAGVASSAVPPGGTLRTWVEPLMHSAAILTKYQAKLAAFAAPNANGINSSTWAWKPAVVPFSMNVFTVS